MCFRLGNVTRRENLLAVVLDVLCFSVMVFGLNGVHICKNGKTVTERNVIFRA